MTAPAVTTTATADATPKSPQNPQSVSPDSLKKAVQTLKQLKPTKPPQSETHKSKHEEEPIFLVITFTKPPCKGPTTAYTLPLTHPLPSTKLCLFISDNTNITDSGTLISKIITLSELKTDYKDSAAKRRLCDSYDVFFADLKVGKELNGLLGKCFYRKKKVPVPVEIGEGEDGKWRDEVERVLGSAMLFLGNGTCSVVKVGKVGMEEEEVVENVVSVVDGIVKIVNGIWENVRSLHLKLSESLALPVYQVEGKKEDGGVVVKKRRDGKVKRKGRAKGSKKEGSKKGSKKERGGDEGLDMDVGVDELVGAKFSGEFGKKKRKRGSGGDEKYDNVVFDGVDKTASKKSKKKGSKKRRIHEIQYVDAGGLGLTSGEVARDIGSNARGEYKKSKNKDMDTSGNQGGRKKSKEQSERLTKTKKKKNRE